MNKKLEQRTECLVKANESESGIISLFREPGGSNHTLIKTFTVDEITPQGVIDAIKEDMENVNLNSINDYVSSEKFNFVYEKACDDIDGDGIGSFSWDLEGDDYMCCLCIGNDTSNYEEICIVATLSVKVFAVYDKGDRDEYGYTYGGGWYVDEDETRVEFEYIEAYDSEDLFEGSSPTADKIREVVAGMVRS